MLLLCIWSTDAVRGLNEVIAERHIVTELAGAG